jgi:hypothetical protein
VRNKAYASAAQDFSPKPLQMYALFSNAQENQRKIFDFRAFLLDNRKKERK